MPNKNCLLFLYMVPGTGHQIAAEAIMTTAAAMDPRIECIGIDAANHAYPWIGNMVNRMYLQMLKRAPFLWEYLYDNPDVEEVTRDARGLLTFISSFRIQHMFKKFRPVAMICTQAAPAVALAAEKRRGHLRIPIIGVITDFGVHTYWLHPEIDLYLVGHEDVKQEMIQKGIDENRIRVTGIPIRPKFGETISSQAARQKLRMNPNKRTLLVMGGSQGLGPLEELVDVLKTIPSDFQAVVVCGKNRRILKKITDQTRDASNFHVMGYVRDSSLLMSAADLLISKPGGLTCSEALAKQLPMVLTSPIPGQEERNVRFLLKHHVARVARTSEDLAHILIDLFRHPQKIQLMRQRAKLVSKPHSAWEASRLIFDLINSRGTFAQ